MTVLGSGASADIVLWDKTINAASPTEVPMIRVDYDTGIAVLTVGSGLRRNALPSTQWTALASAMGEISRRDDLTAVLIRGTGNTFCAGSDIREWVGAPEDLVETSFTQMEAAFRAVEQCPIPVIAQIAGVAAGAGCQLALACDIRIMADNARIGMPIARLGINASPSFADRMIRVAGPAVTAQLLYTGRLLDGPAAVAAGLANQSVDESDVDDTTYALLADVARQPTEAIRAAKAAIGSAMGQAPAEPLGPAVHYPSLQRGIGKILKNPGS